MKFFITGLLQLILGFQLFSQTKYVIKPENADCNKAIEIKDTIFGPTIAPNGYGSVMEISGDKSSLYAFEKEHNTCWYYFKGKNNCDLEIEIIPEKIDDDYDFVLYKYSGKTFCQDIIDKKVKPVRTCISRNDKTNGSKTGLSKEATDEFIHSGPGSSYSKYITIKKGDIYYLCVDNVYPNGGGHTVILHYSDCKKPLVKNKTEAAENKNNKTVVAKDSPVKITVVDKDTQMAIKAHIIICKQNKTTYDTVTTFDSVSWCETKLSYGVFSLKAEANNYFDNVKEIKTCSCGSEINLVVELSRIKVGQNVVFENILFFGNSAQFLPESKPVLEGIVTTMKRNPGLEIEIQGHVNCPNGWSDCGDKKTEFNMQLSISRAKAVYDFLDKAGIDTNRMTFKGFGATRMIYPNARSEEKMAKNRRVEIVVMAF
jgi:outer membrane protein OmpA-like peptidoglycan-associated protein